MKLLKKSIAFLMVVLLLAAVSPTVFAEETDETVPYEGTEVDETVYATTAVNIRSGPGMEYRVLGLLRRGEAIRRTGVDTRTNWSRVIFNGVEAYIYSDYLTTTKPANAGAQIDDSKLTYQVAVANGLKQSDYTRESWEALAAALEKANEARLGSSQAAVDSAEKALEAAVSGLIPMDYSTLEASIAEVRKFLKTDETNELWIQLAEAVSSGTLLLSSGDQAAVDAAAAQINELLAQVTASVAAKGTPEVVTKEVRVEVPPTDDFCNIPMHRVWPVLFFVSLAVNVALAAVIVVYVSRKKKNQKDDTPLVDYDIFDDTL